jgi:hypothetical protein
VAVMLNLSPNHLDRHPSLQAYAEAKRQIFRNQRAQDYAVLNADDPWVAGLAASVPSHVVLFSRRRELPTGVFVSGGKIYYRVRHLERVLFEASDVSLRGDFNLEDVLAATTAACVLGADFTAIRKAVRNFKAVEHRLEFVQKIAGVDFYNNSKATSVDATLKSLEAFETGVHLIMGGKDKGAPYTPLAPLLKKRAREVLLIGAAAPMIAEQLKGAVDLVQAGDLATAVYEAFARSRPGDTVLLAPACSSFDQFADYEERGRVFKDLVKRLAKDVTEGRVVRRDTGQGARDKGEWRRDEGQGRRDTGEGIRNPESGIRESRLAKDVNPEPEIPSPLSLTPYPLSRPPCPETSRIPLTYVYEVDAEESPGTESQVVPEDEPVISISASAAEALADDALPFEARPAATTETSEVRGPKSEAQSGPESQPTPEQPRLFDGKDPEGN